MIKRRFSIAIARSELVPIERLIEERRIRILEPPIERFIEVRRILVPLILLPPDDFRIIELLRVVVVIVPILEPPILLDDIFEPLILLDDIFPIIGLDAGWVVCANAVTAHRAATASAAPIPVNDFFII